MGGVIYLYVWRSEDSSWGVSLSFYHVGSGDETQSPGLKENSFTH